MYNIVQVYCISSHRRWIMGTIHVNLIGKSFIELLLQKIVLVFSGQWNKHKKVKYHSIYLQTLKKQSLNLLFYFQIYKRNTNHKYKESIFCSAWCLSFLLFSGMRLNYTFFGGYYIFQSLFFRIVFL